MEEKKRKKKQPKVGPSAAEGTYTTQPREETI